MKKTYYFQHDFEAISDPKIQYILAKFGGIGYGLWWRIVEMLHQEDENKLQHKEYIYFALSNQLKCEQDFVKAFIQSCIQEAELLDSDGEYFWSERVLKNVGKMQDIKEKRSSAGKKSAEKRIENQQVATSVQQNPTSVEQNPTKENKRKENKKYSKPSLFEVISFFNDNGFTDIGAIKAYNYYDEGNWTDSKGNKVKNWKQKMRGVWFRDEYKINKPTISNFSLPIN
jgi:hypothetical protein